MLVDRRALRRTAVWVFVGLLSERALSVRTADEITQDIQEEEGGAHMEGISVNLAGDIHKLHDLFSQGQAAEEKISCEEIQEKMLRPLNQTTADLHRFCTQDGCDFTSLDVDDTLGKQQLLTAAVTVADKKRCLPDVLGSPAVQKQLEVLLSAVPKLLDAPQTPEGRVRIQEVYSQMVAFQAGAASFGKDLIDRRLLFPTDVQTRCPDPCAMCDQKGVSGFSFRCLLRRKDKNRELVVLRRHGVTCSTPQYRFLRWYPFQKICKVADWKEEALQHVHVSLLLSCATETVIQDLHHERTTDQRQDAYRACTDQEPGVRGAGGKADETPWDGAISPDLKLAFGNIIVMAMASGLAGLRQATRMEVGAADLANTFQAAFAKHLPEFDEQRQSDVAMYASTEQFDRQTTLDGLDGCEQVYSFGVQHTFAGGTRSLTTMGHTVRAKGEGGSCGGWPALCLVFGWVLTTVAFFAILSTASFFLFIYGFAGNWWVTLIGHLVIAASFAPGLVFITWLFFRLPESEDPGNEACLRQIEDGSPTDIDG